MNKIGLDFRVIGSQQKSGVENYILFLAREMPKKAKFLKFYFFVDSNCSNSEFSKYNNSNVKIVKIPTSKEKPFWFLVKIYVRMYSLDLFHLPISMIPKKFPTQTVITVYDLTYEKAPQFYEPREVELQKTEVRRSVKIANAVITISQATKDDIVQYYKADPKKIYVTYLSTPRESTKQSASLPDKIVAKKYFLAVGNIQPRKNFPRLIEAFANMKNKDSQLVIVGKPQTKEEVNKIERIIRDNDIGDRVRLLGHVSDETLAKLYSESLAVVFPSIYEGFGYPIVEAFYYKVPVITSDRSAMVEIAKDAAAFVDPESAFSITTALDSIDTDKNLREKLVKNGAIRLHEIQTHSLVDETLEVYKKVLSETKHE